mmetsp:Transcript_57768/g.164107  ORF Transcript_57768/g.164107 Transcript_57768/m.164107 type:complete len:406 (+) Transcript_57768:56-1273(+)
MEQAPSHAVQVVSETWDRDSHGLFDFEVDHHTHRKTFTVAKPTVCVRRDTFVKMMSEPVATPPGSDRLVRLARGPAGAWEASAGSSEPLWHVVKDAPLARHCLSEGDVIKLGRFVFRVRQLATKKASGPPPQPRLDASLAACVPDAACGCAGADAHCRICLLEGGTEDDPLIAPCACKGSIEHVHLSCLQHWIRGRLSYSDSSCGSFFYRPLACELCECLYPMHVRTSRGRMPLVEVPQAVAPFVVLESTLRESGCGRRASKQGFHVISLAEKQLRVGRDHNCEVRMSDASISRCHATISLECGKFVLQDNQSKFGTLVATKEPCLLAPGGSLSVQMGRTLLRLSIQPCLGRVHLATGAAAGEVRAGTAVHDLDDEPGTPDWPCTLALSAEHDVRRLRGRCVVAM